MFGGWGVGSQRVNFSTSGHLPKGPKTRGVQFGIGEPREECTSWLHNFIPSIGDRRIRDVVIPLHCEAMVARRSTSAGRLFWRSLGVRRMRRRLSSTWRTLWTSRASGQSRPQECTQTLPVDLRLGQATARGKTRSLARCRSGPLRTEPGTCGRVASQLA